MTLEISAGEARRLHRGARDAASSVFFYCWADSMMKCWKNLSDRPLRWPVPLPTYLPTYPLGEAKKEIRRWVKVRYYTN